MRPSWLCHRYEATFQLDDRGPTWAKSVMEEIRLPRWAYEGHDRGAAVFVRALQSGHGGPTEARLRLLPEAPKPSVTLEVSIQGRWTDDDETRPPAPGIADVLEEAEALLVLLGCRSPRFRRVETARKR